MVQRAPWQPTFKVPINDNVVCFDAAFSISITYKENPTKKRVALQKKCGSAENVCNWWAKMYSQASEDIHVTQIRGSEKQWAILPGGDSVPKVSIVVYR